MSDTPGNKTSNLCGDLIFTFRFDAPQHQDCRRRRSPLRPAAAFGGPRQNQAANTSARSLSEAIVARMKTSRHPRCCPACGHRFIFWQVWLIDRSTCISCPSCGVRLRACLETTRCAAARDFGCGQGGEFRASPQRAVRNEPTLATDKRPAARRVFAEKAVWLRPARECFRSCSVVAARSASFVAPRHPAFSPKTAPLVVSKQALR